MEKKEIENFVLTSENYYSKEANEIYMSVSQWKDFYKCELYGLMKAKGEYVEEKSPALLAGGYMDAYFSHRLEQYKLDNPQMFKKDGTLKSEYEKAEKGIKAAESDEFYMEHIKGQTQVIVVGVISGVKFKACYDFLNDRIVDMKLVASITEPVWKYNPITKRNYQTNFIDAYGYDIQGAVYQELGRQAFGTTIPFDLAPISKEDEPDKAIINIDDDILDEKLELVKELAPRYDLIKKGVIVPTRCGVCPVCRKYKKLNEIMSYKEMYGIGDGNE